MNKDQILEAIASMNVLELSELVKAVEEKFGVSAAMPMIMGAAPAAAGSDAGAAEEPSTYNVELINAGTQKIQVIKALREVTSLGLKEAKDLVDSAPKIVKESATKEEAEAIKKKLEEQGASVTLK